MRFGVFLAAASLCLARSAFAQGESAEDAERAYQAVDFPSTHSLSQQALRAGGNPRQQTARLYVLMGIAASTLGDTEEAKQDFTVALAIDPELKLDKSLAPKIREPYLEAQGFWSAASERLTLSARPGRSADDLIVQLSDPAALVAKLELRVARPGAPLRSTFTLEKAKMTRFKLPAAFAGHDYEFSLRALDSFGNVLAEHGSDAEPELVRAQGTAQAPTAALSRDPVTRSYLLPAVLGLAGLGSVTAGIVFHVKREQAAREWNGPGCENPGATRIGQCQDVDARRQTDERFAIGFYAAGGALLTGSVIALIAGRPVETAKSGSNWLGCSVFGKRLQCDGHF